MKFALVFSAVLGLAATSAMAANADGDCAYKTNTQASATVESNQSVAQTNIPAEAPRTATE